MSLCLRNVLSHWPAECPVQPEGFFARWSHGAMASRVEPGGGVGGVLEYHLRPLAALGSPGRLGRRWPGLARRVGQWAYGRAFRREFARGYAGAYEPNNLAVPVEGPTVTLMHDLSVLEHPQWHPADRVAQWRRDLPAGLAATGHWIAASQFTRGRMVSLLGLPESSITVIPLAARELPYPSEQTPRPPGLPEKFLVHLGTLEPRKNISLLLDAYGKWPAAARRKCRLILAGPVGWGGRDFWQGLVGHPMAGEVLTAGYLGEPAMAALLARAQALLAPSRYEGFGLPLLEAMAAGTPVIGSNIPAFAEVAGAAADLLDPDDAGAWSERMARACQDAAWRQRLSEAGRARNARYSWQATAAAQADLFVRKILPPASGG